MKKGLFSSFLALVLLGSAAPAAHAALSWNVTSYDFGNQEFGISSVPHVFTLSATCDLPAPGECVHVIGGVDAPGADFNVDSTSCTGTLVATALSPASCNASVSMKPSSPGPKTGVLTTFAGGPSVALNGVGVDPEASKGKRCNKRKGKRSASAAKKKKKCKRKKKNR